jgi:hypothetical protein
MKRLLIIAISIFTLLAVAGGVTLAYILTDAPELENSFNPVFVDCEVVKTAAGTPADSDVSVKNKGDISAYIRATFVVNWVAEDGTVYGAAPIENTDYRITFGSVGWAQGSDGFYYYSTPVESGAVTDPLIIKLEALTNAPKDHKLSVHVAAKAIQSQPARAVESAWGVTVLENGILILP